MLTTAPNWGHGQAAALDGAGGMTEVHERRDLAIAPLRLWLGPVGPFTEQVVALCQHRLGEPRRALRARVLARRVGVAHTLYLPGQSSNREIQRPVDCRSANRFDVCLPQSWQQCHGCGAVNPPCRA